MHSCNAADQILSFCRPVVQQTLSSKSSTGFTFNMSSSDSPGFNPAVPDNHLQDQLTAHAEQLVVNTKYGPVTGARATNGAAAFLGGPSSPSLS